MYLPLDLPVTLAFMGARKHATTENFIPNVQSLSLAIGSCQSVYNPALMNPLPAAHPGLKYSLIAWGDHEERRRIARQAARKRGERGKRAKKRLKRYGD